MPASLKKTDQNAAKKLHRRSAESQRDVRAGYECPPVGGRVLLTVKQTAAKVGCHELNIYKYLKNKKLGFPRPIKLAPGRTAFFEQEVDDYLASRPRI